VGNLKAFASTEDGERMAWTDLNACMDSALNIAWHELKHRTEVERHYGVLPQVCCRPAQINQILLNLLLNAVQAVGERGKLVLRSGADEAAQEVWVEVEDNGPGVPPDIRQRIFDPFFTTKPVGQGTGLGLSIAWGIAEAHGGRLTFTSTMGRGSCFRLTLPTEPRSDDSMANDATPPAPLSGADREQRG
jgi:signal transduction histidine kinase